MSFRNQVPWWLRIAAKILLAPLPVGYAFWKRLDLFEHGDMNQPASSPRPTWRQGYGGLSKNPR